MSKHYDGMATRSPSSPYREQTLMGIYIIGASVGARARTYARVPARGSFGAVRARGDKGEAVNNWRRGEANGG